MEYKVKTVNAAVIGGVNMDIWGRPDAPLIERDSNPGRVLLRPGGVGRNIAHDLRLLGVEVSLAAPLGTDVYAEHIMESCRSLGIDMSMAQRIPDAASSIYMYMTDDCGNMQLAINDMAICESMTPERVEPLLPLLNRFGALVLDANLPAETIAFICQRATRPVYADPVSAVKAARLLPVLDKLAAIKPNALEAEALTGERDPERAAAALLERGVGRAFVSLGADGLVAADRDELLYLPGERINVVNSTGAGDAATAAIVWAGLHKKSLADTARAALRAGALTCLSESANTERLTELIE